jgi:uncharacterized repeat protein (TIGR01451 family)
VAQLTLHKSADPAVVNPGDLITYSVQVANDGAVDYAPASFVDDLSQVLAAADFVSASATVGSVQFATPVLSWSGPLAPGESGTVTYTVRVHASAGPGAPLVNGVQSDLLGSTCPVTATTTAVGSTVATAVPAPRASTLALPAGCTTTVTVAAASASPSGPTPSTVPPTTAPPTVAPPTIAPTGTAPPTTGPTAPAPVTSAPTGGAAGHGTFPLTGAAALRLVVLGLVLLAGSLVLLLARRRTR